MRRALHAEWTKLRTLPGTVWLLLGIVAGTVGISALAGAAITCRAAACGVDQVEVSLTGIHLGQAIVAILAVLVVGGEYSSGMAGVTFAAMPRRATVLAAKALVVMGVVLAAALVAVPAGMLTGRSVLAADWSVSAAPVLRAVLGSVLYFVLVAVLSVGVAAVVRSSAAAIGVVLGLAYVYPLLVFVLPDEDWQRRAQQIAPITAGSSIQATTGLDQLPIGPWAGLGVLAAWALGLLLVGALAVHRRDGG